MSVNIQELADRVKEDLGVRRLGDTIYGMRGLRPAIPQLGTALLNADAEVTKVVMQSKPLLVTLPPLPPGATSWSIHIGNGVGSIGPYHRTMVHYDPRKGVIFTTDPNLDHSWLTNLRSMARILHGDDSIPHSHRQCVECAKIAVRRWDMLVEQGRADHTLPVNGSRQKKHRKSCVICVARAKRNQAKRFLSKEARLQKECAKRQSVDSVGYYRGVDLSYFDCKPQEVLPQQMYNDEIRDMALASLLHSAEPPIMAKGTWIPQDEGESETRHGLRKSFPVHAMG